MNPIVIKKCHIQKGHTNICVPLVAKDYEGLQKELMALDSKSVDIVEWRMDHYADIQNEDAMKKAASLLRKTLHDLVLLCTFRRVEEGGVRPLSMQSYAQINRCVIKHKLADMIDVEYSCGEAMRNALIKEAHAQGIYVIMSCHDFEKTPSRAQLIKQFQCMEASGADIVKMACMPNCEDDVFALMSASKEAAKHKCHVPLISMSMGKLGMVSRVFSQMSDSVVSFASLQQASAPGQLHAEDLRMLFDILHKYEQGEINSEHNCEEII